MNGIRITCKTNPDYNGKYMVDDIENDVAMFGHEDQEAEKMLYCVSMLCCDEMSGKTEQFIEQWLQFPYSNSVKVFVGTHEILIEKL